jgi:sialate O-acetylesterase
MRHLVISTVVMLTLTVLAAPGGRPFLHGLFTDNMILQRDVPCPIWGWTDPGAQVTVAVNGQQVSATADAQGKWLAKVGPFPAGGPTTVTITGPQTVTLNNVLFGDVWLCSGQSNMEWGLKNVDQWWKEYGSANLPRVRLYTVPQDTQTTPPATVAGAWRVCTPDAVIADTPIYGGFSAIAFFYGRKVHQETGVPIGLIESCWGATDVAQWSTLPTLRRIAGNANLDPLAIYERSVMESWKALDPAYDATKTWSSPAYDASAWKTITLPKSWQKEELPGFAGVVWLRKEIELPADWEGKNLSVTLGAIDAQDTLWMNGAFIGAYDLNNTPRIYTVPGNVVHAGKNVLCLRVLGNTGVTARADQLTLMPVDGDPKDRLSLAGPWQYCPSTPMAQVKGRQADRRGIPAGCYQAMIAPLAPCAIKGVIWYQGEGDVGMTGTYRAKTAGMIADWRALFGVGDFPFYLVQLAGYGGLPAQPEESSWAVIREAQAAVAATVPNCGMAVAIDRGEIYNIHPPNKRDVGERLAMTALAKTYGKPVACQGPTYKAMTVEGRAIRLIFDHAEGLRTLGSGPSGFAIAGADGKYVWAQAYLDGETVVVSSPQVPQPVMVRYGWANHPLCNLYNQAGLPAVPFRTDAPK